jgi:tetratricopeptide (TPR) repeat protein
VLAALAALWQRRLGAALLLGTAAAASLRYLRLQGLAALVVIVVGSQVLEGAFAALATGHSRLRRALLLALAAVLVLLAAMRVADLASDRSYVVASDLQDFGMGGGWYDPERAAAFIEREQLPGNIFAPYNLGGFLALRLGPRYPDYVDGRAVGHQIVEEQQKLMASPVDGPEWQQVADARGIQTLIFSLARTGGLEGVNLPELCRSRVWAPVYLDEVSLVMLRRTAQNQPLVARLQRGCGEVLFAPPQTNSRAALYQFHANAGAVLYALSRDAEAEQHWRKALALFPDDPNVHLFLAQLYRTTERPQEAEEQFRAAVAAKETAVAWYGLGRLLAAEHRWPEAEQAIANSAELALQPANNYKALAQARLKLQQPAAALASAFRAAYYGAGMTDPEFWAQLAEVRAEVARQQGKASVAVAIQQHAVELTPKVASRWRTLASLESADGRQEAAAEALRRAEVLDAAAHPTPPASR